MRFCADGPSLPDELLVARDEGQVIFFCGAGVSRAAAGLPDFYGLARDVVDRLGAASDSPARKLIDAAGRQERIAGVGGLLPADRVFALLEREFETADVHRAVAQALQPSPNVDLSAHRTLLDLGRAPDGSVRLVTTNFDLLFEACEPQLLSHAPPRLPDPSRPRELAGITHLHGRVDNAYSGLGDDEFVLSSADFGRAYLAEGWATGFIRGLMDGFQLVFVGYAADDPPVQYLLEALNNRSRGRSNLYAFQAGAVEEASTLWRDRGVHAIAYEDGDNHSRLWRTLEAWAERARDPEGWYERLLVRSKAGPRTLQPFERGQIKHMVSTAPGARRFANQAPSAEWLCVFDPAVRYARPSTNREGDAAFDPFGAYGLDDDKAPAPIDLSNPYAKRDIPKGAWDAFAVDRADRGAVDEQNLAWFRGAWALSAPRLPPRIFQLARWLSRVAAEPAAAWWAAGQDGLHRDVQELVLGELRRAEGGATPTAAAWRSIIRSWPSTSRDLDAGGFELQEEVATFGWSPAAVRQWASLLKPRLRTSRPFYGTRPPEAGATVEEIVELQVDYPKPHVQLVVPNDLLCLALVELRRVLETGADLHGEARGYEFYSLPSISPDHDAEGDPIGRDFGFAVPFLLFSKLFERLAGLSREAARLELFAWRRNHLVFDRLRVWAAGLPALLTPREAASVLIGLRPARFWSHEGQRDLLLTLRARWTELAQADRARVLRRTVRGPPRYTGEGHFRERRAFQALERLTWLAAQGCDLGEIGSVLEELRAEVPDWNDARASRAAASAEGRSSWVATDRDPGALLEEAPAALLARAAQLGGRNHERFVERRPLEGLAKVRPVRTLRALVLAGRSGDFPPWAWRSLLSVEERKQDKPRLMCAIAERLAAIPSDHLRYIARDACDWLRWISPRLARECPRSFERLWASLINVIRLHPDQAGSSVTQSSGTDWVMAAINSPGGRLAEALMALDQKKPKKGFPPLWLRKVDDLLSLPDDARRHAAVVFLYNVNWFYAHDPEWSERRLLQLLDGDEVDRDVFWAGVLWAPQIPRANLMLRLKPAFLRLVRSDLKGHDRHERLSGYLLAGWGSRQDENGMRYISDEEMRDALIGSTEEFRSQVLWHLEHWYEEDASEWRDNALEFLRSVWPRQRSAKSAHISARLCDLAFSAEDAFPQMVDAIAPLLTEVGPNGLMLVRLGRSDWDPVAKYPEALLTLLYAVLPVNVVEWPYRADRLVERLVQAPAVALDPRAAELRRRMSAH